MENTNVKRNFKASLFSMIFGEKSELLSLYNAINGSHYEDPDLLEITTIQDVLYMGLKNDQSFIIGEYMNLYEAQSTWNSNMPLRGLFYFSSLYQGYVESRHLDIYSGTRLELPTPKYVVLYNGTRKEPEYQMLRLSESFTLARNADSRCLDGQGLNTQVPNDSVSAAERFREPALECIAEVYNINWGHNQKLMEQCRKLYEYAYLVEQARAHLAQGLVLAEAIDRAVEECIKKGILEEFLLKHRAEVKQMILTEYNEELHIQNEREIARKEGMDQGIEKGREQGIKALILDNLEEGTPKERILEKLQRRFDLDKNTAAVYYEKYSPEAEK